MDHSRRAQGLGAAKITGSITRSLREGKQKLAESGDATRPDARNISLTAERFRLEWFYRGHAPRHFDQEAPMRVLVTTKVGRVSGRLSFA
jgi:hypothetical protein